MYHAAKVMPINVAVGRIRFARPLDGCEIPINEVLNSFAGEDAVLVVDRAVVPSFAVPMTFKGGLDFRNCVFIGDAIIEGCEYLQSLMLISSIVHGPLIIAGCGIAHDPGLVLELRDCQFHDKVIIGGDLGGSQNRLQGIPTISRSQFENELVVTSNEHVARAPMQWWFDGCQFDDRFLLEDETESHVEFKECRFGVASLVQIHLNRWAAGRVIGLERCVIEGRIVINPRSWSQQFGLDTRNFDMRLVSSFLHGTLDLIGTALRSIDLRETTISGGRLVITVDQMCRANDWFPADQLDRESILASELQYLRATNSDDRSAAAERVAREFEELRNAFATTPLTDMEEDFCHYKSMEYAWRHRAHELLGETSGQQITLVLFTCLIVGLAVLYSLTVQSPTICGPLILVVAWCAAVVAMFRRRTIGALRLYGESYLFKWCIGWGVCVHRVMIASAIAIGAFAVLYACLIRYELGDIEESCGASILEVRTDGGLDCDNIETQPRTLWDAFVRLLYFSGVTFTTLGYGDYHPTEWLQMIAVSEALLGALAIAVVTVLFARKFMRG